MPTIISIIIAVVAFIVAAVITRFLTVSSLTKDADLKIGSAETRAREIIDDALKTAETTKKEALLEVKEESIKTKSTGTGKNLRINLRTSKGLFVKNC